MAQHFGHDHDHEDYPAFFEHNEIILLLEHGAEKLDRERINDFLAALAPSLGLSCDFSLKKNPNAELDQPFTTFGLDGVKGNVSLVYAVLDGNREESPEALLPAARFDADQQVIRAVDSLLTLAREHFTFNLGETPVTLRAASPNWLFSAAPHQLIDGGPGGRPVEVTKAPAASEYAIHCPSADDVIRTHVSAHQSSKNSVTVAILDAVPPKGLYDEVPVKFANVGNPLLLAVHNRLHVVRRDQLPFTLPLEPASIPPGAHEAYTTHSADYEISDHGLFVAGTVHSLAPEANLLLLEVLNRYGIGSVETLAKGITALWDHLKPIPEKLIVNCSLCISFQNRCTLVERYRWEALDNGGKAYMELLLQPLRDAINSLYFRAQANQQEGKAAVEVRIVAAAGNDGDLKHTVPPFARFPAAFEEVLGVGALANRASRAYYSNLTDDPTIEGLLVFGGEIDASQPPMSDAKEGMLGLYIGSFPGTTTPPDTTKASKLGWARWSGTSFATGVMSGLLAKAGFVGMSIIQANAASLQSGLPNPLPQTPFKERILESWQG